MRIRVVLYLRFERRLHFLFNQSLPVRTVKPVVPLDLVSSSYSQSLFWIFV